MSADQNISRPWVDADGRMLSDEVLREITKSWDLETWDRFLIETVEGSGSYMREKTIHPWAYDSILEEMTESIWDWAETPESADNCARIRLLLRDHLTPRQQHVLNLIFWHGYSERMVAEILGIGRSSVAVYKSVSLKKIKGLIERRTSIRPFSERADQNKRHSERSRNEDIRDVYQAEINNPYGKFRGA